MLLLRVHETQVQKQLYVQVLHGPKELRRFDFLTEI